MTAFHDKVCLWIKLVVLLLVLSVGIAGAEDGLSVAPGQGRVAASVDFGRLVVQATPQEVPPSGGLADVGELRLSLREAVLVALKNNLDIAIAGDNPKINAEGIVIEKAVFDPVFSLTADANRTVTPVATALAGPTTDSKIQNRDLNASLTQKLPIGGSYTLSLTNNRVNTNSQFSQPPDGINPSYTSFL